MIMNAMDYGVSFPLYVCLDDGEIVQIESLERILYHLEAVDIENDEYMFWDAGARGLRVLINKGGVGGFEMAENKITLNEAFEEYARQLGITIDTSGAPEETWAKLQKARESPTTRRSLFTAFWQKSKIVGDTVV
jgi:hypothetical protein